MLKEISIKTWAEYQLKEERLQSPYMTRTSLCKNNLEKSQNMNYYSLQQFVFKGNNLEEEGEFDF